WIQARSDAASVVGLELLAAGRALDSVEAEPAPGKSLILPEVEFNDIYSTEVHLANATRFRGTVTFRLRASDGSATASPVSVPLEPKARFSRRIEGIFPSLAAGFVGYLLVDSDQDLAAAELLVSARTMAALRALPRGQQSNASIRLHSPYLETGGAAFTRVNLVNLGAREARLTLRAYGLSGEG